MHGGESGLEEEEEQGQTAECVIDGRLASAKTRHDPYDSLGLERRRHERASLMSAGMDRLVQ